MDGFSKRYAQFILLCRPAPTMIVAKIMDIVDTIQSVKMSTEHILEMILTICTNEQVSYLHHQNSKHCNEKYVKMSSRLDILEKL